MQISLEDKDQHTIRAYTDTQITINDTHYNKSLIISPQAIISHWPVHNINELDLALLKPLLELQPEIILIGHHQQGKHASMTVMQFLSQKRIGIECMSLGSACRTFNILLSEQRNVVLGVIF